jgi:tryptophan synthase alpha chain
MSARTSSETRLGPRLRERRAAGRPLLVPYVTAGFPDLDATPRLMADLAAAGADAIELGVPFSDPLADGPTIQGSSQAALEGGGSLDATLRALRTFRSSDGDTPVVLFTYLNPIMRRGPDRFPADALEAGADGILLTDLPMGEDPELEAAFEASPLDLVRLIAPTTPPERALRIAARAQGFLYYISRAGVTGARSELREGMAAELATLRRAAEVPVVVGFGISTPAQAAEVAGMADGVVVGSALIDVIREGGVAAAGEFIASLRRALDEASRG